MKSTVVEFARKAFAVKNLFGSIFATNTLKKSMIESVKSSSRVQQEMLTSAMKIEWKERQ